MTAWGDLNRMNQWKDKRELLEDRRGAFVSAGLFTYPVLQAADVLAYKANEVPVGDDQRQHIELMREIARRFNERFGETLVVPDHRIPEVGARIMDLQDPTRKMATTGGTEGGTVLVLDEPDVVAKKFMSAVTDSGSEVRRAEDKPGVTNLIDILAVIRDADPGAIEAEFASSGYGDFKRAVADEDGRLPDAGTGALRRAAPRHRRARDRTGPGRRQGPRHRVRHARGGPRADGHRPRERIAPGQVLSFQAMRAAELDLDLDVFAGPFDLLMTLVLREELSLAEVALGRDRRRLCRAPGRER